MGLFNFLKQKKQAGQPNDNGISEETNHPNIDVYRELFFVKIQPYIKAGLLREIYHCSEFSIYAFGEKVYIVCPYIMLEEMPYGIYMTQPVMRKIIQTNRKIYPLISEIFSDPALNKDLIFMLQEDRLSWWKKWLIDNQKVNKIDKAFERELQDH